MAHAIIQDVVMWTKHVHGGEVAKRLEALPGETELTLVVDGYAGRWCKMRDGKDGRPSAGVRPIGRAQQFWQSLFESRKGESVTVELSEKPNVERSRYSAAEREAARAAVLAAPGRGWRSDGRIMTRDEMNER